MNDRIKKIDVYLVSTPVGGNIADSTRKVGSVGYAIVVVTTEQGLRGIGVTYHEVGGEAVREFITRSLAPTLIGKDPLQTETIWEETFHYIRGVGRKGLAFCALSAVDIALWDLKGKTLGLPLYRLLGGSKTRIPVYASGGWTSYSTKELVAEVALMVDRGYAAVKVKVGVDGGRNPAEDVERIRTLRKEFGDKLRIMVDANNVWRAAAAVQVANRIREFDIEFFEEPVFADDIPGLAQFKRGTDIPLATGEHEYLKYGVRDLLAADAADIIQCDVTRCGGFTETLKIIGLTQAWNRAFAPHGMEYLHLHLVSAATNGIYVERLLMFEPVSALVFKNPPMPKDGFMEIPDAPGLGLELNMKSIERLNEK